MKNVFKRFVEIFRPDFLTKNYQEINSNKTWKFWFLSNTIVAIVFGIVLSFFVAKAINELTGNLVVRYPNAKITMSNGKLSTDGFEEPIFDKSDDGSIFVLDTKGEKYDESVLKDYNKGVFISDTKIYNKKSSVQSEQYDLSNVKQNFILTLNDVLAFKVKIQIFFDLFLFLIIWIYFNALRLISAFFWAFLFWLLAKVMSVNEMDFGKVYFSVLSFYIIPLVISIIIGLLKFNIPFLTFIIFAILFVVNYLQLKRKIKPQEVIEVEAPKELPIK